MSNIFNIAYFSRKTKYIGALAAMFIFLFTLNLLATAGVSAEPKELKYPVSQFEDGNARAFFINSPDGIQIRFFILKSTDGVIRAAFDACDVCYKARKGYSQKGHFMVCNNCGLEFESTKINEVKGGCNPSPLKRQIKDGQVIIQVKDILEGAPYFDTRS